MTTNPYAPPTTELASPPPPPKSLARRVSLALAATGVALFWGALAVSAVFGAGTGRDPGAMSVGAMAAFAPVAHLVGLAIAFAAPRGRMLLPALANGAALVIMIVFVVLATTALSG